MMKGRVGKSLLVLFLIIIMFGSVGASSVFAASNEVYLGGFPLGFDLSSEGALIAGLSEVVCEDGLRIPAKESGLKSGDYILSLNGKKITKAEDIDEVLINYDGNPIIAEIKTENGKEIKNLTPVKDISGKYKLGVLIRDYLSGLGTVTFVAQSGKFVSLGHPITDDEGNLLTVAGGLVYRCEITSVEKGSRGHAGELKGQVLRNKVIGTVAANTAVGLSGEFTDKNVYIGLTKMQIDSPKQGPAEIYATVSGQKPTKYSAAIIKTDLGDKQNKNIVIKITDERLIEAAGGIVRGMSGSPIVQDGKIVGAVTHVFLNDSTRGYGISIAKMASVI